MRRHGRVYFPLIPLETVPFRKIFNDQSFTYILTGGNGGIKEFLHTCETEKIYRNFKQITPPEEVKPGSVGALKKVLTKISIHIYYRSIGHSARK